MYTTLLGCALAALSCYVTWIYASFFEWWMHKCLMHNKACGWAEERHVEHHHGARSTGSTFYGPEHVSPVPLLVLPHLIPFMLLYLASPWVAWGFIMGVSTYLVAYETLHILIHDPPCWLQDKKWFQRIIERHRVHHYKYRWNYNVVWRFADWILGTYRELELEPEPSAPPGPLQRLTGPASIRLQTT